MKSFRFDRSRFGVPFGRFARHEERDAKAGPDQRYVGREGLRAYLIEELLQAGRRRSVLITGRRGSGKTSFIDYVLRECANRRLLRYFASPTRMPIKEFLWLVLVTGALFVATGALAELIALFVPVSPSILLPLILPLMVIPFLVYFMKMWRVFSVIVMTYSLPFFFDIDAIIVHFVSWLLITFYIAVEYKIIAPKLVRESVPEEIDLAGTERWNNKNPLFSHFKKFVEKVTLMETGSEDEGSLSSCFKRFVKKIASRKTDPENEEERIKRFYKDRREAARFKQARMAFSRSLVSWQLANIWRPSLVVRINLGFETPTYEGVLHVMLAGLRDAYRRQMMSWRSPFRALNGLATILLLLSLLSLASTKLFDFPAASFFSKLQHDELDLVDRRGLSFQSLTSGKVNYCAYLQQAVVRGSAMERPAHVPRMLCQLDEDVANPLIAFLYMPLVPILSEVGSTGSILPWLMPHEHGLPRLQSLDDDTYKVVAGEPGVRVRPYHLLLAVLLVWMWRVLRRRLDPTGQHHIMARMDEMLDVLTGRTRISRARRLSLEYLRNLFVSEEHREVDRPRFDPRSVEFFFLSLLEDMQHEKERNSWLGIFHFAPVPEVTFVFDELDKITGLFAPYGSLKEASQEEFEILDAERRRTYALHNLMSDMKRIIASAPARFIFIGNRLLHDEWMADSGRRQPLLTAIFDEQIYLPSLLVDKPQPLRLFQERAEPSSAIEPWHEFPLAWRIWEYLVRQRESAQDHYEEWKERVENGGLVPPFRGPQPTPPEYATTPFYEEELRYWLEERYHGQLCVHDLEPGGLACDDRGNGRLPDCWSKAIITNFVHFLAFRSAGNPKKLGQLLASFVRPVGRCLQLPASKEARERLRALRCHDLLLLRDDDLYRIELISDLWRHVHGHFGEQLMQRDDKITHSIFYLLDFLMKYHSRAFSWVSLERIDELAHLHRAPDVRRLLVRLVDETAEQFLHRLLNGMYDFRFRSEFAVELRYMSRISEPEQAAFNFTLDEAQSLKAMYERLIRSSEAPGYDLVAGLGELYENDQEYETAHRYYAQAIRILDDAFLRNVGEDVAPVRTRRRERQLQRRVGPQRSDHEEEGFAPIRTLRLITSAEFPQGFDGVRDGLWFAPWGVRRLRLMLRIGLLYEQQRNHETALTIYVETRKFSTALLRSFMDRLRAHARNIDEEDRQRHSDATSLLEHLPLLFQPLFAEAWVLEKLEGGADASANLIEAELLRLRRELPFVRERCNLADTKTLGSFRENPGKPRLAAAQEFSSLALTMAELHNKAGDLYFFKGRGFIPARRLKQHVEHIKGIWQAYRHSAVDMAPSSDSIDSDGFLLRAHLHYALGIHELRRFVVFRRLASSTKYNVNLGMMDTECIDAEGVTILPWGQWPAYVVQSLSNNLINMAEVMLARTSVLGIVKILLNERNHIWGQLLPIYNRNINTVERMLKGFHRYCVGWMEQPHVDADNELHQNIKEFLEKVGFEMPSFNIFGKWALEFFGLWNAVACSSRDEEGKFFGSFDEVLRFSIFMPSDEGIVPSGSPTSSNALDRLIAGLYIAFAGTRFARTAGYPRHAERGLLLLAEMARQTLALLNSVLAIWKFDEEEGRHQSDELARVGQILDESFSENRIKERLQRLTEFLVDYGTFVLLEYDRQARFTSTSPNAGLEGRARLGCCINPMAMTTAVGLVLHAVDLLPDDVLPRPTHSARRYRNLEPSNKKLRAGDFKKLYPLLKTIETWVGESCLETALRCRKHPPHYAILSNNQRLKHRVISILEYTLSRHRYPMLNRLHGLKILVQYEMDVFIEMLNCRGIFSKDLEDALQRLEDRFNELVELYERFEAELHFTPAQLARTAAEVALRLDAALRREDIACELRQRMQVLGNRALRCGLEALAEARESFTHGQKYYDTIKDMYYLFDDFNDRYIHLQRAVQMMSMEILSILQRQLNEIDKRGA